MNSHKTIILSARVHIKVKSFIEIKQMVKQVVEHEREKSFEEKNLT